MVVLSIAMKQDEAIKIVESIDENVRFIKKQGMSVFFETPDDKLYLGLIKKTLKASTGFSALYFNCSIQ